MNSGHLSLMEAMEVVKHGEFQLYDSSNSCLYFYHISRIQCVFGIIKSYFSKMKLVKLKFFRISPTTNSIHSAYMSYLKKCLGYLIFWEKLDFRKASIKFYTKSNSLTHI